MGNEQGKSHGIVTPSGIQSMDETLQRKFAKGIQYNMKIVVRGDRNTGKTCLFHRMQGKAFIEAYIPTNEIQVASILWSYKVSNDTVKVEVWDIVDKGRVQKKSKGILKMFNDPSAQQDSSDVPLDAEFLDVYKGAHGVVFMFDMTKQWTWKYIERELPHVPLHIPVMVLGNFRDMGDHRVLSKEDCQFYIDHLERPEGAAEVRYAETSMKDGFGLMHLHKFLSIPFLQLQQESLLQQLQVNREQTLAAREELSSASNSEDQSYDLYKVKVQKLGEEKRRRAQQKAEQAALAEGSESPASPVVRDTAESGNRRASTGQSSSQPQPESPQQRSSSFTSKLTSRFSGFLARQKEKGEEVEEVEKKSKPSPKVPASSSIDDFKPEGQVDSKFFDSEGEEEEEEGSEEESSEEEKNPQVAMDEDLSSSEESAPPVPTETKQPISSKPHPPPPSRPPVKLKAAKDVELTESEEESSRPAVSEDVDFPETGSKERAKSKGKQLQFSFMDETFASPKEGSSSKGSKSGGLLLAFNDTPSRPKETKESPDVSEGKREKKRKKSKKSKLKESAVAEEEVDGGGAVARNGPGAVATVSEDPFGLTSSLDAWLSAGMDDSSGLGEVLQPIKIGSQGDSSKEAVKVEVGEEEKEEEEESKASQKSRKHRHKKHRDREGGEGSHRKKHRHKSRHSQKLTESDKPANLEPTDYQLL